MHSLKQPPVAVRARERPHAAFTAVAGQYGTGVATTQGYPPILNQAATDAAGAPVYFDNPLPTAHVTGGNSIAFGWTGTNTYAGVADLDGQWQTAAITLNPGTYTATMTELTPDCTPVVDHLGRRKPDSVAATIIVEAG